MSSSAAGTVFRLRTPAHIKSCQMTGSWDNYNKKYTLKPDTAAGPGWWTLTLKFGSSIGVGRFWYYYILDGYFESHDPNMPTCKEPTRNITLNILDIFASACSSPTSSKRSGGIFSDVSIAPSTVSSYSDSPRRVNAEPELVCPKPRNPMANHKLTLDTNINRYTMLTSAATTCGSEPSSAGSSRTSSSCSSPCSDSPITPIYSDDECYDSEDDMAHYKGRKAVDADELSYRLQHSLRV